MRRLIHTITECCLLQGRAPSSCSGVRPECSGCQSGPGLLDLEEGALEEQGGPWKGAIEVQGGPWKGAIEEQGGPLEGALDEGRGEGRTKSV